MSTRFFTNEEHNTLLKKFEGVFAHNRDIQFFDALVGYFRASGYFALRPHLEHVPNIRILVGINVDKLLARSHSKGMLFKGNPQQTIGAFLEEAKADVQKANYSRDVEAGIQEERDEHLVFLMELRKFKEDHPEQFRIIRNMPLRARTGRKDKTKTGNTTCFIRNPRRDAFYHVSENGELEELTFVECARIFKADLPEKALPLHDRHHEQVSAAKEDFSSKLQDEITQSQGLDAHQNPHEKKALAFLDAFLHLPITGEQERFKIQAAKTAIRLARFQKLQRAINRLQTAIKKKKMTNVELLDSVMGIINKYPLDDIEDSVPRPITQAEEDRLEPDIIISESFARE